MSCPLEVILDFIDINHVVFHGFTSTQVLRQKKTESCASRFTKNKSFRGYCSLASLYRRIHVVLVQISVVSDAGRALTLLLAVATSCGALSVLSFGGVSDSMVHHHVTRKRFPRKTGTSETKNL